jgi:hypothetical protein
MAGSLLKTTDAGWIAKAGAGLHDRWLDNQVLINHIHCSTTVAYGFDGLGLIQ